MNFIRINFFFLRRIQSKIKTYVIGNYQQRKEAEYMCKIDDNDYDNQWELVPQ